MSAILHFNTLKLNAIPSRKEFLDGKLYLVSPVVAIVEGVLNGEFVPAQVIEKSVQGWNGVPVMINHPKRNGEYVGANSPDVISESVGRLFNVSFDGKALHGEIWLDINKCKQLGGEAAQALDRIESGSPVEVSTGYYASTESSEGTFDGTPFFGIQTSILPDHLALLPNAIGACSWQDGCGVPRINETVNKRSSARTPKYSGTETTSWADVSKSFQSYRDGYYKNSGTSKPDEVPTSVASAPSAMKTWIASKTLLGEASAQTTEDLISFPVVNPSTNKLNAGALRAAISRAPQANIPQSAQDSIQRVARRLLTKEFGEKVQNEERYNTMSNLFGVLKGLFGIGKDEENSEIPVTVNYFTPSNSEQTDPDRLVRNGRNLSALLTKIIKDQTSSSVPRRDIVKRMADTAGIDKDKMDEILQGNLSFIPMRWLMAFATALDIDAWDLVNAANTDGYEFIKDNLPAFKEVQIQNEDNTEIIDRIIANSGNSFTEEDKIFLNGLGSEQLKKFIGCDCKQTTEDGAVENTENKETVETKDEIVENSAEEVKPNEEAVEESLKDVVADAVVEDLTDEVETNEEAVEEPEKAVEEAVEEPSVLTIEDVLAKTNAETKTLIEKAIASYNKNKAALTEEIAANSELSLEDLADFDVEKLEKLAASLRKKASTSVPELPVDYSGRAIPKRHQKNDDSIPLPPPVVLAKK